MKKKEKEEEKATEKGQPKSKKKKFWENKLGTNGLNFWDKCLWCLCIKDMLGWIGSEECFNTW